MWFSLFRLCVRLKFYVVTKKKKRVKFSVKTNNNEKTGDYVTKCWIARKKSKDLPKK